MAEVGILTPRDRVVLLDGFLVLKTEKSPRHVTATGKTVKAIETFVPEGWMVIKEDPVSFQGGPAGADSEPEPDVAVVRGTIANYAARHPGPGDIALVVEVAESSLAEDRAGLARYAWANIPSAWIVNLNERVIEVYTDPTGPTAQPGYRWREVVKPGGEIPLVLDGQPVARVAVADLLA
jgi:Uma2 family endonuclease